ncbi:hypothetical protein BDV3_005090 [Batrachochytrium dendrobatidis]
MSSLLSEWIPETVMEENIVPKKIAAGNICTLYYAHQGDSLDNEIYDLHSDMDGGLGNAQGLIQHDYKVLECPPELVAFLQASKTLVIRGCDTDEAVLCTDQATYSLRQVETSNSMLLLQNRSFNLSSDRQIQTSNAFTSCFPNTRIDAVSDVIFTHSSYLEVACIPPKLAKLELMLNECLYAGSDTEACNQTNQNCKNQSIYSLSDFLEIIQASEGEIIDQLNILGAFEINGFWRLLAPTYALYILQLIMLSAVERDMDIFQLSLNDLAIALSEDQIPEPVLKRCLLSNSDSCDTMGQDTVFKLSRTKICRLYGDQMLRELTGNGIEIMQFLKSWQSAVPLDWEVHLDQIKGLYLLDGSQIKTIRYFPKSLLATDPRMRFEDLFKIRKKWLREDMLPFIEDLATTDKARELLLLKNARISKQGSNTYFTPRFTFFSK